jgi:two-component system, cell cycle response regulator
MLIHPTTGLLNLSHPPAAERSGRVLVVEPDDERRTFLNQVLTSEGYESVFLPDGDELLRVTAEYEPDLILLAVELPNGSGLELCGELRASDPTRHYPVILIGGDSSEQNVARGLLAGADDFMGSPDRQTELRARIRVQLRNKRFYDALQRLRVERDSLRRDAQTDPLTGLLNRRSLEATISQRCQARDRFGVLFMDLDHFKSINDRFGHDMGDKVLAAVAEVIRVGLRPGDVVGRYGGEEFIAVVAGAGPESARLVAERLRRAVEEMSLPLLGPKAVSISIGTTVFDPRQVDETAKELVHRADLALYAAKRAGRNRVITVAPGETLPQPSEGLPVRTSIDPPEPPILIGWERTGSE